jgi:hypothetical protein
MSRFRELRLAASTSTDAIAAGDVFEAMLDGWRDQQPARSLNEVTIDACECVVRGGQPPTAGRSQGKPRGTGQLLFRYKRCRSRSSLRTARISQRRW